MLHSHRGFIVRICDEVEIMNLIHGDDQSVLAVDFKIEVAVDIQVVVLFNEISQSCESFYQCFIFLEFIGNYAISLFVVVSPCPDLVGKVKQGRIILFLNSLLGFDLLQH
jgi:hypothetical protein